MPVKMYKTLMGWTEWKSGDKKHPPTHRLLTEEEYQELQDRIQGLQGQLRLEEYNSEQRVCREPLAKLRYFRKDDLGNVAYDYRFAANYKSGYWEVTLCHTLPLGQVPKELRRR